MSDETGIHHPKQSPPRDLIARSEGQGRPSLRTQPVTFISIQSRVATPWGETTSTIISPDHHRRAPAGHVRGVGGDDAPAPCTPNHAIQVCFPIEDDGRIAS